MISNDSIESDEPRTGIPPESIAAHELTFGRESTSGYLLELEQEADHAPPVQACAERVDSSSTQRLPLEQHKPTQSLRI